MTHVSLIIFLVILAGIGIDAKPDEGCTSENKQKSLYGTPQYSPTLGASPATSFYTTYKGVELAPLRAYNNRGYYAATMMRTKQNDGSMGPGGYFGVQWKGKVTSKDQLIFSIWDKKQTNKNNRALPMHDNCKRNCNDCSHDDTTGTQCKFQLKEKLEEGEELTLRAEREAVETSSWEDVTYTGHVWKVTYESNIKGEVITLGRILMSDNLEIGQESSGGVTSTSMFLEPLGCMNCEAFAFEIQRKGPFITATADNKPIPEIQALYATTVCRGCTTCRAFSVVSEEFGSINLKTGNKALIPSWDVTGKGQIY